MGWWVFGTVAVVVDGLRCWWVSGAVAVVVDGLIGADGFLVSWLWLLMGWSATWVSDRWLELISGLGGGCGGRCLLQLVWWFVCVALLMVCVCVWLCWWFDGLCLCVWLCWWFLFVFVCVCMALCVWWWVWIGWSVYHGSVCVALCVEPVLEVEGERGKKILLESPGKSKHAKVWKVTVGKK